VGLVNGTTYTGIPTTVTTQFITTGKWGLSVAPKIVSIATLNGAGATPYMNELIELDNTQFAAGSGGVPYVSSRVNLRDCSGEDLIQVYTSQYTYFANFNTPTGNGNFIGVYTSYNGSPELLVRDPSDINAMTGTLCP
jgi:hypothetical protein